MAIDRVKVLKQAENFLASGKTDRAIDEFLKLLEDNPRDLNLMNRIGDSYMQLGKIPDAMDMFKRAGMGYERDGFTNKAAAVFKKAHRAAPEDEDVATRLAELFRQTNMIKDAMQIHMEMAEAFTRKGLIKRALIEFGKVVELDPKNLKNKVKLADLYNKEGMKDRAAGIYLEVAEALAFEGMHAEASQIMERAKTMTSTPQLFLTWSKLCVVQKDLAEAARVLKDGISSNPRNPELLEALAEIELQKKNPEGALEALSQVPQLPEKALSVCERALREMIKAGQGEEGIALFKNIGREFARRGGGDRASQVLRTVLQQVRSLEGWLLMAEIAHQGGNKDERVQALRQAYALAEDAGNTPQVEQISKQLSALGIELPHFRPSDHDLPGVLSAEMHDHTDVDPMRRIRVDQMRKQALEYEKSRFPDKAVEVYQRILEEDPADLAASDAIAEIIKSSGRLAGVQQHYLKHAEKLNQVGRPKLAGAMLDRAERLFPGSTRMQRRMWGLPDFGAAPQAAPAAAPQPAPTRAPMPMPPGSISPPMPEALDALIPLDDRVFGAAPAPPVSTPPPPAPPPLVSPLSAGELNFDDWSPETLAPESLLPPNIEPLELEPLPFDTSKPPVPPPVIPAPIPRQAIALPPPVDPLPPPPAVDEELASTLSDIDFQMDYGSPEEAKIEIENSIKRWPSHPELLSRLERVEEALRKIGHAPKVASLDEDQDFAHSFFDLTDVLGDALLDSGEGEEMHDATNVVEKVHSVEELFSAFREGVEQQVRGDDYDTHYNLGIAYKEMILIEPAMEEFKKAMRDPERTLECCSMLSICEAAQSNLDAAEAWLRKGIEAPGFPPEDTIGLLYDLGDILVQTGRPAEAKPIFQQVMDLDPTYREIAQKLH